MIRQLARDFDNRLLNGALQKTYWRHRVGRHVRSLEEGARFRMVLGHDHASNRFAELCDMHGSDKGGARAGVRAWPTHSYANLYTLLFDHCRPAVRRVFECGIGTNNTHLVSNMGAKGRPGASLRVWRDYFPNALVIGADIDRDILFQDERISTYYVDQTDPLAIRALWQQIEGGPFDLMIDDGLHTFEGGSCLFENSIGQLSENGIYVIEDIHLDDMMRYRAFFADRSYRVDYVNLYRPGLDLDDNNMILVRHG